MSDYVEEITEGDQLVLVLPLASDPTGGSFDARAQRLAAVSAASIAGVVQIVDSGSIQAPWAAGSLSAGEWRIQIAGETDDHPFETLTDVMIKVSPRLPAPGP